MLNIWLVQNIVYAIDGKLKFDVQNKLTFCIILLLKIFDLSQQIETADSQNHCVQYPFVPRVAVSVHQLLCIWKSISVRPSFHPPKCAEIIYL